MQDELGACTISFPKANTNSDQVSNKGNKDVVELAKNRILEVDETLYCLVNEFIPYFQ